MKILIALLFVACVGLVASQCTCSTMKWSLCEGPPCVCKLMLGVDNNQVIDCTKLIPKCYLMKAEMHRARTGQSTRSIGGKPVETAFVDNDGIYDPECESDGKFKAKQCNGTEECWCVNSAGVRRSDKGDKNIKCDPVETYWVRLEMKHKDGVGALDATQLKAGIQNAFQQRYQLDKSLVKEVKYDKDGRLIVVDVEKDKADRSVDLSLISYYMEKDIKVLPLYLNPTPFGVMVAGSNVTMENVLVYYVDAVPPTFTMKKLTGGVIAVIVVVSLIVIAGILVLVFLNRRDKTKYSKAQGREMETMS